MSLTSRGGVGRGEAESRVREGVLGERRGITEPDYTWERKVKASKV